MDKVKSSNSNERQKKLSLRGDIIGGITASVLAMAESMAYGALALAPLGLEYALLGSAAGLIALAFSNIGASLFSGVQIMINGPYALTSLMLATALRIITEEISNDPIVALIYLFLIVLIAGLIQILFGVLRLGNLTKYVPYPVIAGLSNGTAILILVGQFLPLLGVDRKLAQGDLQYVVANAQPLTLLVGILTILATWLGKKYLKRFPAPLIGVAGGTIAFYLLSLITGLQPTNALMGAIPFVLPTPRYAWQFWQLFSNQGFLLNLVKLLPLAGSIAVVLSLKTLLNAISADNLTQERSNNNQELISQGAGNSLAALFGGIASVGTRTNTSANYVAGGRASRSKLFCGLFALLTIILFGPLLRFIPKVVLAGILVTVAISAFDTWSLNTLQQAMTRRYNFKNILEDTVIILLVMFGTIFAGVFEAVGLGLVIALIVFILRMSKDIIRRDFDARSVRSHVNRPEGEALILEQHGHLIRIFELEGVLFFGSADKLADHLEPLLDTDIRYIILDFKRISDIDSTGVNILGRIYKLFQMADKKLLLSGIQEHQATIRSLDTNGIMEKGFTGQNDFIAIEDALAWAEDQLLDEFLDPKRHTKAIALQNIKTFDQLNAVELDRLFYFVHLIEYEDRSILFRQGDSGDEIFFIQKGRVDIYSDFGNGSKRKRIAALSAGTVLGEIEVLDKKSRSGTAVANGHLTCLVLSMESIQTLARKYPEMTYKILLGLGKELAGKVRIMNALMTNLKS